MRYVIVNNQNGQRISADGYINAPNMDKARYLLKYKKGRDGQLLFPDFSQNMKNKVWRVQVSPAYPKNSYKIRPFKPVVQQPAKQLELPLPKFAHYWSKYAVRKAKERGEFP